MPTYNTDARLASDIAKAVSDKGGICYFVGGYVRDNLLGIDSKDIDIEVHGVSPDTLQAVLAQFGTVITIGSSFGVYNIKGYSLDIAMPRKESTRGAGHRDFDIYVDPFIGTEKAAVRRDFTINSLMQNVLTGEITDHFGGLSDLEKRIIRHVNDDSFAEDPLRVLRGAQFAARFGFEIAEETIALCAAMDLTALSRERIEAELKKALLKSDKPSVFFENLRKMNQLDYWFIQLNSIIGIPQNPHFHSEGDVWNHTMMVLDEAAEHRNNARNPFGFMLAALCHDFGKAVCTKNEDGKIRSIGHEKEGLPLIEAFMHRITTETKLINYVLNLCALHMKPNALAAMNAGIKATNKMFDQCTDPTALVYMAMADNYGRIIPCGITPHENFLFKRLEIYNELMSRPFVQGKDLIGAGLIPDENFSSYLEFAHKLRLAGTEKQSALKQTLAFAKKANR
ncbi:MAG: tRNA nucleotidyltransferase [Oscillospiraceae bacterium]|nr:tRNA nucleotidyltransferase [Oscillospiraceae bacterium]